MQKRVNAIQRALRKILIKHPPSTSHFVKGVVIISHPICGKQYAVLV